MEMEPKQCRAERKKQFHGSFRHSQSQTKEDFIVTRGNYFKRPKIVEKLPKVYPCVVGVLRSFTVCNVYHFY